ncbi:MAG: hypothetical protein ACYC27_00005 [Armatimonadota bacterium]
MRTLSSTLRLALSGISISILLAGVCAGADSSQGTDRSTDVTDTTNTNQVTITDLSNKLQSPFIDELYKRTYQSILDRVEDDGFFQESVNGAYIGMFPRTVGGLVSLFMETGETEKARKVVDIVLKSAKANNMHRCPHVMDRRQTENAPIPAPGVIVSGNHSIALYKLDSGFSGAQKFVAPSKPVVAAEAWISSGYSGKGSLRCSISESYTNTSEVASVEIPKSKTSESGNWTRFKFSSSVKLTPGKEYYLHIKSTGDAQCIWWGSAGNIGNPLAGGYGHDPKPEKWLDNPDHITAFAIDTGDLKHKRMISYPIISRMDQLDGNFHVLTAWAMVALNTDNKKWERDTYPQVVDMVNTAVDWPYLPPQIDRVTPGLIHNFCLEHSREGRYWDTWDILTQSWACRGLRLLSKVADRRGDTVNAKRWADAYTAIERAIRSKLTMEVDGKLVYAEMRLPNGGDGTIFGGLSWVNLSPVQAQWDGADPEILKNTVHTLRNKAAMNWHGRTVTGVQWTIANNFVDPQVIGKGVGWDIAYAVQEKNYGVITNWLEFIEAENYTTLYAEAFNLIDGKTVIQDPGNGEQVSWWCWGIAKARKAAGLTAAPK